MLVSPLDFGGLTDLVSNTAASQKPKESDARHSRPNIATVFVPPRNELEREIADICGDILGVDPLGIHDDFLELGGHSLLFVQIMTRLRQITKTEISVKEVFDDPTVGGLAFKIENEGGIERNRDSGIESSPSELEQYVLETLADVYSLARINPEEEFSKLGSTDEMATIVRRFEEDLKLVLPADIVSNNNTAVELAQCLESILVSHIENMSDGEAKRQLQDS